MTYRGHVENGAIVLDDAVDLPEGVSVRIESDVPAIAEDKAVTPTVAERLASVIGKAEGLPADWSENHDHYLREEHGR